MGVVVGHIDLGRASYFDCDRHMGIQLVHVLSPRWTGNRFGEVERQVVGRTMQIQMMGRRQPD